MCSYTDSQREDTRLTVVAEFRVMQIQTKTILKSSGSTQSWNRQERSSLELPKGAWPC